MRAAPVNEQEATDVGGEPAGSAAVRIRGLSKTFRRQGGSVVSAVDGVDLDIAPGEMVVLLGPSGCGKTTLLRSLVGLETPDTGSIFAVGRNVFSAEERLNLPPEKRGISMMFQNYALWPHMSVGSNVEYPLTNRRIAKAERRQSVIRALKAVGLAELADQYPRQLSGGQQQRVALARSLVTDPDAVVFDEPLSNVDAQVRQDLRVEILAAQRRVGFAGIYVTHDQYEAMQMATRLAVMRAGKIVQIGTPEAIYTRPRNRFVATFVGTSNILDVHSTVATGPSALRVGTEIGDLDVDLPPGEVTREPKFVAARPEALTVVSPDLDGVAEVTVETVMFSGSSVEFTVFTAGGRRLRGMTTADNAWMRPDDKAVLRIAPSSLQLLED
jgi:iron(III) transport system ATP-binding protein